jgi:hypothetical protein
MPSYKIQSWNAILQGANNEPTPMIYIKPNNSFSDYAEKNNNIVLVRITGSSIYDNRDILATINSSLNYPVYRPNFYKKTGYYCLTLSCGWFGYPLENGDVKIQGLVGEDAVTIPSDVPFVTPKIIEWPTGEREYYRDDSVIGVKWIVIFLSIILFLLVIAKLFKCF